MIGLALLLASAEPKLPAWNARQPPPAAEAAVLQPIDALFAALAARDSAAIQAQGIDGGSATSVAENADGTHIVRQMSWADFAAHIKPGPERYEERLTDPAIEIDGDIAMVWSPYLFLIDGKVHHCGVDHFDLIRRDGAWKVLHVTWTSRTVGCGPQA
jgi:hypothetical protein